MRIAGTDIGTNTILMMIAELDKFNNLQIIRDEHSLARLGENTDKTKTISSAAISRAITILDKYKKICDDENVEKHTLVATSAMRDAVNGDEVKAMLENTIKENIQIITGEEEALFSFLGTVEDENPSAVIDIGGGSTEFITGKNKDISFRKSINIGAVRITERFFLEQPIDDKMQKNALELIRTNLTTNIDPNIFLNRKLYAVAGTPTTIAASYLKLNDYEFDKINGFCLTKAIVNEVLSSFIGLTPQEISEQHKIHPLRADVITAGTLILSEIMNYLDTDSVIVSALGLRYGILKANLNKHK